MKFLLHGLPLHLLRFYIIGWPVALSPEDLGNDILAVRESVHQGLGRCGAPRCLLSQQYTGITTLANTAQID
jgi:hypothetical protein